MYNELLLRKLIKSNLRAMQNMLYISPIQSFKGKDVHEHHAMKAYWGSGGIAPCVQPN